MMFNYVISIRIHADVVTRSHYPVHFPQTDDTISWECEHNWQNSCSVTIPTTANSWLLIVRFVLQISWSTVTERPDGNSTSTPSFMRVSHNNGLPAWNFRQILHRLTCFKWRKSDEFAYFWWIHHSYIMQYFTVNSHHSNLLLVENMLLLLDKSKGNQTFSA